MTAAVTLARTVVVALAVAVARMKFEQKVEAIGKYRLSLRARRKLSALLLHTGGRC